MSDFVTQSIFAFAVFSGIVTMLVFIIWFFHMEETHRKGWWGEEKMRGDEE
jgi:hypothetical protein